MGCSSRTSLLLLLVLVVAAVITQAQKPKDAGKEDNKFCPLEYKGNKCKSRRQQFKCGAFFVNLHGQSERLRWITALPDALVKESVRRSPALLRPFGNIKKKNFRLGKDCDEKSANGECLDLMHDLSTLSLESCERNILNERGTRTLGNVLCEKAGLWAPGQHFQSFVSVGFYHSACGSGWTETRLDGQALTLSEELCCKFDNGRGRWFRCDGSPYKGTCNDDPTEVIRVNKKY